MIKKLSVIFILVILQMSIVFSEELRIKLATTTSTENSGLLGYILPAFEKKTKIKIDVIAVGTGKALKLGENGDVDVVLVHARKLEDKFVADGFGVNRKDVMYNDFIILGPKNDPVGVEKFKSVVDVFKEIANKNAIFISRGDNSGTHTKEKEIWEKTGITPKGEWYKESGTGMEEVINMANNLLGYTLADRGTYISLKNKVDLTIVFEKEQILFNPYGIIAVNPKKYKHIKYKEAMRFINWLTSKEGLKLIKSYKIDGEQLFYTY